MKTFLLLTIITASFGLFFNSCAKLNEEELMDDGIFCADSNVSYQNNVQPILENNCYECHSSAVATNGVILDNYTDLKDWIDAGYVLPQINRVPGAAQMPYGRPKLNACKIETIEKWVEEGMLNN